MKQHITLELHPDDAEPFLREAARKAALYSAYLDYITTRTYNAPSNTTRKEWQEEFLKAKRIVEAFGVEYQQTSEAETLTVHWPMKILKSHLVKMSEFTFRHIDKSEDDPKRAMPEYRRDVHAEACRQAAQRVVKAWRQSIKQQVAA